MGKYTTITVKREIVEELNFIKRDMGAKNLGETIERLIHIYRRMKAKKFVENVSKIRETGLKDVKEEIMKLRKLK